MIEKADFRPSKKLDLYIGVSKKSTFINRMDEINQALEDIINEGKIKEFSSKYYDNN